MGVDPRTVPGRPVTESADNPCKQGASANVAYQEKSCNPALSVGFQEQLKIVVSPVRIWVS